MEKIKKMDEINRESLNEIFHKMIDCYFNWAERLRKKRGLDESLIKSYPDILSCICGEKNTPENLNTEKFRRDPHQLRIHSEDIIKANNLLEKNKKMLLKASSFDELYDTVWKILFFPEQRLKCKRVGKITGIGDLTIYDFCCRFGKNKQLKPQSLYLHRGTQTGANILAKLGIFDKQVLKNNENGITRIRLEELQKSKGYLEALNRLDANHLEIFLCVKKNCFENLPCYCM